MTYKFLPKAEEELDKAIWYYEKCQIGLGKKFTIEIFNSVENILLFPRAWSKTENECRRILIKRFPYGIIYSIEKEFILIVSVMNLHRKPYYWKNRIKK